MLNVIRKEDKSPVTLKSLKPGDCFRFDNQEEDYLVLERSNITRECKEIPVLRLDTASISWFHPERSVVKYEKATVTLE